MAAPHNPNTTAATETRKLKVGEASISHRIRGSHDLHKWLAGLTPKEIGGLLDQIRQSM